jgi:lipoyl(octanoyl) transferase
VSNSRLAPPAPFFPSAGAPPVEWRVAPGLTAYADAVLEMEARAGAIAEGRAAERVWLVEHPPLYTAGTSARDGDLIDARFPVHRTGRGVWVARPEKPPGLGGAAAEDKIAALGIRVRRWVSFHGVAVNVAPDLTHFQGIVPCGIADAHLGVTSLRDLGSRATMTEVDAALRAAFEARLGATE